MVGVAQLVERLTVAQNVAGSSPVSHPIFLPSFEAERVGLKETGKTCFFRFRSRNYGTITESFSPHFELKPSVFFETEGFLFMPIENPYPSPVDLASVSHQERGIICPADHFFRFFQQSELSQAQNTRISKLGTIPRRSKCPLFPLSMLFWFSFTFKPSRFHIGTA